MKKILSTLIFLPLISIGQTKITISSACSYFGEKLPIEVYSFSSDNEAQTSLARITYASGLPTNFKLVAGNVPNACATLKWNASIQGYDRYIIYNQTFMERLKNATNDWAALSILAHEVGHHLSGHSLISGGSRPELELEADKFSGFILAKLGATLQQAQVAINALQLENYSVTHPPKSARLAAIANGWVSASSKSTNNNNSSTSSTSKERPNRNEINVNTVKWKKATNGVFWIYYKPTEFYFESKRDFELIGLQNGNQLVYFKNGGCYWIMPEFNDAYPNTEYDFDFVTCLDAVFIRSTSDGFWIYDKGLHVDNLEFLGFNHESDAVYRSKTTGKRYWIEYNDYKFAAYSKPKSIISE
jgi:hypothetical protein